MGHAQKRQNKAVAVLKILIIFLWRSYFHHAAEASPLFELVYDNAKCTKLVSNDINL